MAAVLLATLLAKGLLPKYFCLPILEQIVALGKRRLQARFGPTVDWLTMDYIAGGAGASGIS